LVLVSASALKVFGIIESGAIVATTAIISFVLLQLSGDIKNFSASILKGEIKLNKYSAKNHQDSE
jgi:hypothetical protein